MKRSSTVQGIVSIKQSEEITLTHAILDSKIVVHETLCLDEICVVCGERIWQLVDPESAALEFAGPASRIHESVFYEVLALGRCQGSWSRNLGITGVTADNHFDSGMSTSRPVQVSSCLSTAISA